MLSHDRKLDGVARQPKGVSPMAAVIRILIDAVSILGVGICCFQLVIFMFTDLETSRKEARITLAFHEVRRLRDELLTDPPTQSKRLPDRDPWGQPYRVVVDRGIRVLSSGPNQVTSDTGNDVDDIDSQMGTSPTAGRNVWQRRLLPVMVALALGTWILMITRAVRWHWIRITSTSGIVNRR